MEEGQRNRKFNCSFSLHSKEIITIQYIYKYLNIYLLSNLHLKMKEVLENEQVYERMKEEVNIEG
ncbi:hypothetical protein [Petrotoga halophila]|uniref:Uncharacterized protein n=1 Tax=Petrotoga halophila DSM 16923 TaxID=1122953 RepID=A0A2S5EDJ0_9BACT|nr:hypothetical protein [Petrotoga halophila]POZ91222.1 hypothetical protein AA81_10555 [Petrotoga halophila DSM 16923]